METIVEAKQYLKNNWEDGCSFNKGEHNRNIDETISDTEANARAKMLIYLLENKLTDLQEKL